MATNFVSRSKFDCICRICLKRGNEMSSLFGKQEDETEESSTLLEKVTSISQVQISPDDGLPDKICQTCHEHIDRFLKFQVLIENSDRILRTCLTEDNVSVKTEAIGDYYDYFELSTVQDDESNGNLENIKTIIFPSTNEQEIEVWKICADDKKNEENSPILLESFDSVNKENESNTNEDVTETEETEASDSGIKSEEVESSVYYRIRSRKTKVRRYHKCMKCDTLFLVAKELKIHLKKHTIDEEEEKKVVLPDGTIKCQLCFVDFQSVAELKNHVSEHFLDSEEHSRKSFKQEETDTTVSNLKSELQNEPEVIKRKFSCSRCAKSFVTKMQCITHCRNHENNVRNKEYQCVECGKCFAKRSELRYHKGIHVDSPPICTICNKHFQNLQSLKMHMKRHTLGSRYICDICNKSYYTNSELARHVQQHAGKRDFPCTLCEMSFLSKPELNRHFKYHRGDKKFSCNICSKSYFESGHLKIHQRTHTGEKPYTCDVCHKGFITKSKLARHSKIHWKTVGRGNYSC